MQTDELISVREYLSTDHSPDRDYVDGMVEDRNVGEMDHSALQMAVAAYFHERRKQWCIHVFPEQRIQVSPTRSRVPDVCVVTGPKPTGQIFQTPPLICIGILSPDDRLSRVQEKLNDFLWFSVPYVCLLDPRTRKAYRWTDKGMLGISELRTENPEMLVPLEALFE